MLYDGAIKNVNEATRRMGDKDPYEFTQNITKTEAIIAELAGAIKQDKNPEVGMNLLNLYDFCYQELISALKNKDRQHLDNVLKLLKDLRDTWAEAIEKVADDPQFQQTEERAAAPAPAKRPSLSFEA